MGRHRQHPRGRSISGRVCRICSSTCSFKGTETRTTNAIAQSVQDEGGYINAYTSFDRTVYWIDVPKAGAATAIDLLADACMNSTLPADEFVKEQEVIRREFAMVNDDPDRVNSQQLFTTAYREHPYRYPVIGYLDLFNRLTRDDVMAYYKARYVPNNIVFVVVGDVDEAAVVSQLETYFAAYPRRAMPPVLITAEPPQLGQRVSHRDFPTELSRLVLSWHIPNVTHPDVPALDVLATALGEGRSSRLYRQVREEKRKLVHFISAFSYVPAQPGLFGVDATTDPDKREAAEAATREIIAQIQRDGLTAPELEKAKRVHPQQPARRAGHDARAGERPRHELAADGQPRLFARLPQAVQQVSVDDIAHVARRYLRDDKCTFARSTRKGTTRPSAAAKPAVGVRSAGEIQRFELVRTACGLLVREDARLPLVYIDAVFRGGLLAETAADNGLTKLFSRVLLKGTDEPHLGADRGGSRGRGRQHRQRGGQQQFQRLAGSDAARPRTWAWTCWRTCCSTRRCPEVVEREKAVQAAAIKGEDEHMTSIARNLLRSTMFGTHPMPCARPVRRKRWPGWTASVWLRSSNNTSWRKTA